VDAANLEVAMDPVTAAALALARQQADTSRRVVTGLPDEALAWRPGTDTNSLAVMITHAWGAAGAWTARAAGFEIERDRSQEFRTVASAVDLIELVDRSLERVEGHLARIDPAGYGEQWTNAAGDDERTRVACLLHALEHTQEHLGQAMLTRQLWEQRAGA
jgi:uncharacterized damage-inducible protein DinB